MANEASSIVELMKAGGKFAELFTDDQGEMARPEQPIKVYRGEATFKDTPSLSPRPELQGSWYTPSVDKSRRYPSERGIMGSLTRSFETNAEDLIKGSYKAMTEHATSVFNKNIENGVPLERAQTIHAKNLNDIDDFHYKYLTDLREGKLPVDRLMQLAATSMEEGIFDQKGKVDVLETFKRGNYPVAAGAGIAQLAEKVPSALVRGAGIAMLPIDMLMGAQQTGLDPQEELAQATGTDASMFYEMPEEQFNEIYNRFKLQSLEAERQRAIDAQSVDAMAP